jgi:hypothetical protein
VIHQVGLLFSLTVRYLILALDCLLRYPDCFRVAQGQHLHVTTAYVNTSPIHIRRLVTNEGSGNSGKNNPKPKFQALPTTPRLASLISTPRDPTPSPIQQI